MENKRIFHVCRSTKSGKTVDVGDFETVKQAREAMLKHYRETPKRGKFWYSISEEELREISGVVFRSFSMVFSDGGRPYFKRFTADELRSMMPSALMAQTVPT